MEFDTCDLRECAMAEPNFYKHYRKLVNLPDVSFLEARPEVRYFGSLRIWSPSTSVTLVSYVKNTYVTLTIY